MVGTYMLHQTPVTVTLSHCHNDLYKPTSVNWIPCYRSPSCKFHSLVQSFLYQTHCKYKVKVIQNLPTKLLYNSRCWKSAAILIESHKLLIMLLFYKRGNCSNFQSWLLKPFTAQFKRTFLNYWNRQNLRKLGRFNLWKM